MKNSPLRNVLPVLFGFFVMGFCDVVGIATSYVKADFGWSETLSGFVPSMVFIWFFILSVPVALWMNRLGRKTMVHISNIVTLIGMLLPFISYNVVTCLLAFVLLGIGNTILQVALNPLLTNVVKGDALTSSLTTGQVVKAVSSFLGPIIAGFAATVLGKWQYLFPIFAAITLLSEIWLRLTPIPREEAAPAQGAGLPATLALLGKPSVLLLFLGIFFVVGVDVGTNTVAPKLLLERCGYSLASAGLGSSVYFICRTVGALLGAVLLVKMKDSTYFKVNILAAIVALVALFFAKGAAGILVGVGAIGFFCSSIFPVIYSAAMKGHPSKENELSGLMIMGVSGGAVIPPLMGLMTDWLGNQAGSLLIIGCCMAYLLFCALWMDKKVVE